MKKLFVVLMACAFVLGLNVTCAFANPKPCAVITNYVSDNLAGKIVIVRASGNPANNNHLLYPNDQIRGDINIVRMEFDPHAKYLPNGSGYVIVYTPPSTLEEITETFRALINSFTKTVEYYSSFVSKGAEADINLTPQPGFNVTLLSGQKVTFSWYDETNKIFSIKDDKGKKVFDKSINGMTSLELDPNAVNFKRGKKYFWSVDGDPTIYKMTLLDEKIERDVLASLAEIDAKDLPENERVFEKSVYVQYISDLYPDQIDLYWLSAQWLLELKPTTDDEDKYKKFLLDKCSSQLTSKVNS